MGRGKRKPSQPWELSQPRASAQLDAFPGSVNQRNRQSTHTRAVVSLRMFGATIAQLDKEAERINIAEGTRHWNKATRTTVVERALADYFAKIKPTDSKRKGAK